MYRKFVNFFVVWEVFEILENLGPPPVARSGEPRASGHARASRAPAPRRRCGGTSSPRWGTRPSRRGTGSPRDAAHIRSLCVVHRDVKAEHANERWIKGDKTAFREIAHLSRFSLQRFALTNACVGNENIILTTAQTLLKTKQVRSILLSM